MSFSSSFSSTDSDVREAIDEVVAEVVEEVRKEIEAEERATRAHRARRVSKKITIHRDNLLGQNNLMRDYLGDNPMYTDEQFRERFRMYRSVFLRIADKLEETDPYFTQRRNAAGKLGLSSTQKCIVPIQMFAYGKLGDAVDDYVRVGESTSIECVNHFVDGVLANFGAEYLRRPNQHDISRLLHVAEQRGFPGMLGSIGCMHWEWENRPKAWARQYTGRKGKPTIVLEAVVSYDSWIWHAFFGVPGSNNDINVLDRSPIFEDLYTGKNIPIRFTVNNSEYDTGYYLANEVYPDYPTFVKAVKKPKDDKSKHFSELHESYRKDVECACGILRNRWAILKGPTRSWNPHLLSKIIRCCIIMHNMCVENEGHIYARQYASEELYEKYFADLQHGAPYIWRNYIETRTGSTNPGRALALQKDLIEHTWRHSGGG